MIKTLLDFLKKKNKTSEKLHPCIEFKNSMDFVRQTLECEQDVNDQVIILDYILNIVREDLKTDLLATILYSQEHLKKRIYFPFPINYYDEKGREYTLDSDENINRKVDLATDCVLVLSWNRNRLRNSVKNIFKNDFKYDKLNHLAYYFTHIDICYAYNGTHSISSGIGHKKGHIEAVECDIGKLFDHAYTDGVKWYNSHNNTELESVVDFRIAILYEVARKKYNIQKHSCQKDF